MCFVSLLWFALDGYSLKVVYKGNKEARRRVEGVVRKGAFNVLLTTYEYVIREKALLGKVSVSHEL